MKRKPKDCPTCNGYVWNETSQQWVKFRETTGLVCKTCYKDYSVVTDIWWRLYSKVMRPWWTWRLKRRQKTYLKQVKPFRMRIEGRWEE